MYRSSATIALFATLINNIKKYIEITNISTVIPKEKSCKIDWNMNCRSKFIIAFSAANYITPCLYNNN